MKHTLILLGLFVLAFFVYDYHNILNKRPQSTHQSRQVDCASYALNYYQYNLPFWKPTTHTLTGKEGRAASEFPIIYYGVAQLYKVFGPQEYIFRLVNMLLFFLGLFYLYRLGVLMIKDEWWAYLPVLFLLTSPYIVYYANNFLANVPALSFAIIGWWAFFKFLEGRKIRYIYLLGACFGLAGMLKIAAALSLGVVLMIVFQVLFFKNKPIQISRKEAAHFGLAIGGALVVILAWVLFARWYNEFYGTGQNLLGILPIWEYGPYLILQTIKIYLAKWAWHWQSPIVFLCLLTFGVLLFRSRKQLSSLNKAILVWTALGVAAYGILWYQAFYHHDYYLINVIILPVLLFLVFLEALKAKQIQLADYWVKGLAVLLLLNMGYVRWMQHIRYYGYLQETVNKNFYTLEPYLRSIGVEQKDIIVSVPDQSPNITLYFANNFGWTEAFNKPDYNINTFVGMDAKYLIVSEDSCLSKPLYKPYTQTNKQIGEYNGIKIFKLK